MKIDQAKQLKNQDFRHLVGVKRQTFAKMIKILKKAEQ
jgi:hypothetical protein